MINKTLGNKTAIKLLKELFKEPRHEFKEIELIKKAKTGKGSANTTINKFIEDNVLIEKRIGKTKIIYLNTKNEIVFTLKCLLDKEKISNMDKTKQASLYLFRNLISNNCELMVVFGSTIAGTSTKKSDIDILLVTNNLEETNKKRREVEELFGERFNLHAYKKNEMLDKIERDQFILNSLLNGVLIYGFDFGIRLFANTKNENTLERLFFLNNRLKSALKNYKNNDELAAKDILDKTLEQLIFLLLSEKNISYSSKEDAKKSIENLPEGRIMQKINRVHLKEKIILSEKLILNIIKEEILKN